MRSLCSRLPPVGSHHSSGCSCGDSDRCVRSVYDSRRSNPSQSLMTEWCTGELTSMPSRLYDASRPTKQRRLEGGLAEEKSVSGSSM